VSLGPAAIVRLKCAFRHLGTREPLLEAQH
jgi:hypothetical protein